MATGIELQPGQWLKMVCPGCSETFFLTQDGCTRLADESLECWNCGKSASMPYADWLPEKVRFAEGSQPNAAEQDGVIPDVTLPEPGDEIQDPALENPAVNDAAVSDAAVSDAAVSDAAVSDAVINEHTVDDDSVDDAKHKSTDSPATDKPAKVKSSGRSGKWDDKRRRMLVGSAVSFVLHLLILVVLAFIVFQVQQGEGGFTTTVSSSADDENLSVDEIESKSEEPPQETPAFEVNADLLAEIVPEEPLAAVENPAEVDETAQAARDSQAVKVTANTVPQENANGTTGKFESDYAGRSRAARAALVALHGGTAESEAAVELGLDWLMRHQQPNGSWSFDHRVRGCSRSCSGVGSAGTCKTGATGIALLSFLGAGYTHRNGKYRDEVQDGINYLLKSPPKNRKGDLRSPRQSRTRRSNQSMYAQGLATLALCEAYGMTKDRVLMQPAQEAIDFIVEAQHKTRGGWRYYPGERGDTSVTGWQVMALRSGEIAKLYVPKRTKTLAMKFLDDVQSAEGGTYGYVNASGRYSTTAIAMLCRMYLGWRRAQGNLVQGMELLNRTGPISNDIYTNYYATQVMHHWNGRPWTEWNQKMRDRLVNSQIKSGHSAGSWPPTDRWAHSGGRLYVTCLSIMTLEVYYRYLPLYQATSVVSE